MSSYQFEKFPFMLGVRDALKNNSTINSWAGCIELIDQEPTQDVIESSERYGNLIWIRDAGAMKLDQGTMSETWKFSISIAALAYNDYWARNSGMKSVNEIEDDIRQELHRNRSVFSAANVYIEIARAINVPPTVSVWGGLYEGRQAMGWKMALIEMEYVLYQRRK